jgi:hypothetical protein
MNREYYVEKNSCSNKLTLIFRLVCLGYYIIGIINSIPYIHNNIILTLAFYCYVLCDFAYTIHLLYFVFIIYLNYNKYFSDVAQFIEWKKNIGLRKYYFCEFIFLFQYIFSLFIVFYSLPIFIKINFLYQLSLSFIYIGCVFNKVIFVSGIIYWFYCICNIQSYQISTNIINVVEECSICMDNSIIHNWTKTRCNHYFHSQCITKWMEINNTCPICRADLSFSL